MNRVNEQVNVLKQLLTDSKTYGTYQAVGQTTWNILVETGLLVWLILCLTLVFFEWFWKLSVGSGRTFRNWFDNLQGSSDEIAAETGKTIILAGKNGLDFVISSAKKQLGLPKDA
jgi:hypothetical protein